MSTLELSNKGKQTDRTIEAVYDKYQSKMMSYAYSILKNYHDAEEAVQSALFAISKKLDSLPDIESDHFKNYCIKAVRNHSINIASSRKYDLELESMSAEDISVRCNTAVLEDDKPIFEAICLMKPIYRDVLIAKYVYELSVKDIARLYGIPTQTVKSRIARGTKLIRNSFKEVRRDV